MSILSALILFLVNFSALEAEPFITERKILTLSDHWKKEMRTLENYRGLETFCWDQSQRQIIFNLLEEIHEYHDALYEDLQTTQYNHSKRTIQRILKHIDKLEEKYNPQDFNQFFQSQCALQSKIQRKSDHYRAGFGVHSYEGKIYVQETEMYRYLKRLTKRIDRIKKHVEHFYIRRKVWEH